MYIAINKIQFTYFHYFENRYYFDLIDYVVEWLKTREKKQITAQLKLLNDYAVRNSFVIEKEFTDNETAKKQGRTNFNEMVKFLRKNKSIKTILVEKTDRLYRNFKDYVLLDEFNGLEIHLVKEGTILSETSKSQDKFMHGIKVLMAKNYIDNFSEEVKKGKKNQQSRGSILQNYRTDTIGGNIKKY